MAETACHRIGRTKPTVMKTPRLPIM